MSETVENPAEVDTTGMYANAVGIPVEAYISQEYARAERDKLWSKVWQQVGRVHEIPAVGDYLTYEIMDDSFIVIRTAPDKIRAYYNACSHRGRPLVDVEPGKRDARGRARSFICNFHGWTYNTEGECVFISQREDWPAECVTDDKTRLPQVQVDTWGGWIWLNMDPECRPLREWLEPAATLLDPFQLENMRFRWRRWLVFDCNWKTALEAFMETYHVPYTHPEFKPFGSFLGWSRKQGVHSNIGYDPPKQKGMEEQEAKLRVGEGADARQSTADLQNYTWNHAGTNTTWTLVDQANKLMEDLPDGTPAPDVLKHWLTSSKERDAARGAAWPTVDPAVVAKSGTAWQIFPNFQIGHAPNNMLCYSARPYGDDPDKCIFEAAVYELFPPGEEPETEWVFTPQDDPGWLSVLPQDFSNMAAIQKGMKARGFRGPRPNPYRERTLVNLHHNLAQYMGTGEPYDLT
jgi:phenylpropionate dioxygenase-like ring-hydroxylating dioxygenase large terminal subunit